MYKKIYTICLKDSKSSRSPTARGTDGSVRVLFCFLRLLLQLLSNYGIQSTTGNEGWTAADFERTRVFALGRIIDGLDVPQRTAVAVCADRRRQIAGPAVSINNVPDNCGLLENVEKIKHRNDSKNVSTERFSISIRLYPTAFSTVIFYSGARPRTIINNGLGTTATTTTHLMFRGFIIQYIITITIIILYTRIVPNGILRGYFFTVRFPPPVNYCAGCNKTVLYALKLFKCVFEILIL